MFEIIHILYIIIINDTYISENYETHLYYYTIMTSNNFRGIYILYIISFLIQQCTQKKLKFDDLQLILILIFNYQSIL